MNDIEQKQILLVDDDPHIRLTVGDFLGAEGYEVIRAGNGAEAMAELETIRPDLVLLDIMMPGQDGGDVARQIRADPDLADVPIAYLTAAVTEREVSATGGTIGGEKYISKTALPEQLLRQVASCMRG
jgi:DNA-binding response OmpR family regulator